MTDPRSYPDPVEDAVRRSFAVRAEDMAGGDDPGAHGLPAVLAGSAAGASTNGRGGRPGRLLLVAAIVVVLGAALAAVGLVVGGDDADEETGDLATGGDVDGGDVDGGEAHALIVDLVAAQRHLLVALEDERNLAAIQLIGQDDLLSLPVDDAAAARRSTDDAIAALQPLVAADPAADAYRTALEQLAGLAEVRSSIDAYDGPRTFQAIDVSNEAFDSYGLVIDGMIDAEGELVPAIDDPDLRSGVEVHHLGLRLLEATAKVSRASLLSVVTPGDAAAHAEVSELYEQIRQGQDDLVAAATGTPYEDATVQVLAEIDASGLLDLVAQGLEGPVDLAGLLDATNLPPGQGWFAFLERVETLLADAG